MSDLDKLQKKYEKDGKAKEIRDTAAKLRETPSNPDTKRAFESRKETLESLIAAAKQATAGFKSQWSGLNEKDEVGIGKGTPGIYYNTVALPAIAGEKYAPDFAVEAENKAGKINEAVRKDLGIEEPRGALQHFAHVGGEMLGQLPVPGRLMAKILGGAKKMGMAGKVAVAPFEYLSPTIDPKAINYGIGTAFGGTLGTALEDLEEDPVKKALGGLIQKYDKGGKVGTFFSAVDKAINTLKQKKGTGEQILKQLESTPGVKSEELEARGIKQKLQSSPKITQEELQKTAKRNKPAIPKRIVLGDGVDPAWRPKLEKHQIEALNAFDLDPIVDPATGKNFGFYSHETGEVLDQNEIKALSPEELGLPVNPDSGMPDDPDSRRYYMNLRQAVDEASKQFNIALDQTGTKFGPYSRSKGQDNYREILLQHENAGPSNAPALNARLDELLNSKPETEADAQAINEEINQLIDKLSTSKQYTDTHWSDPNIFAHYRVSDMTGPNGERVLYVDEIQSDWHQKARDSRKQQIKNMLISEKASIDKQALEQLRAEAGNVDLTPTNMARLKKIELDLTKERKAQLEKEVPENAGYRAPEDDEKLDQINKKIQRLRDVGMTREEIKEYYTPGKIIGDSSGYDKVLSFNEGSKNPKYQQVYDSRFQQAINAGVGPEVAANFAKRKADEDLKHDWSVTVVQVDPRTGEPLKNGYGPRTHQTSPEDEVRRQLQNEAQAIETKKPDAPFKKNWHELAVRDILDLAAKEGYDKVAFSPGIEQVKRYSDQMRKAVDEIQFAPTADGQVVVTGIKGGSEVFNGTVLGDTFVSGPQKAIGKTLEEVFGGKIGKQIEEQAQMPGAGVGKISGEDLTIGGEGMKSFYDQRLPSYVKEYGKKEFKAPTGYMEVKQPIRGKAWTPQEFRDEMIELDDGSMELMEMAHEIAHTRAEEALAQRGLTREVISSDDWDEALWDEMDNHADAAHDQALRTLAQQSLEAKAGKENTLRAFSIDVTPEMKEKITTQGQRLHGFVAPQILPPLAAGAAGAEYVRQSVQQPPAEPQEPPQEQAQEPPEEPQAFDKGGKVGKVKEVFSLIGSKIRSGQPIEVEVFHGSPTTGIEKFKKSPPAASKGLADSKAGAFWGTANREQAKEYALGKTMENQFPSKEKGSEQGEVYDILASLKNPLVLWDDNYLPWDKNHAASVDSPYTRKFALEYAKKNGHDGVVFANKSGKKREVSSFEIAILPDEQGEYPGVIKKEIQVSPEDPQGFENGGRVGKVKEAIEKLSGAFKKPSLPKVDEVIDILPKKEATKNLNKFLKPSAVKQRVFHGTNIPEAIVEDKQFAHYGADDSGIHWFSENPEHAEGYTSKYAENPGDQGGIFPVNLQIKNPLKIPFNTNSGIDDKFKEYLGGLGLRLSDIREWAEENDLGPPSKVWQVVNTPIFKEAAKYRGFDGIKIDEGEFSTWGAFEPTQIKSQFNRGSYDVTNPDIGFADGGRVGKVKEAAEGILRVLHGSPTKIRLDKEKNLDVTTDESYAMKRARDKMDVLRQVGPPMLNRFDAPASKILRFEESYSPEDVALMRRFFSRLPEGRSMTGEEIYDAAGGKDYVLEGLAKAGGFAGYERPAGGAGGKGNWYRITDQDELTRKAQGGLMQFGDGGKVDLARRGLLGLKNKLITQTENLPTVGPASPLAAAQVSAPDVVAPLTQMVQKAAETPMSRRDVLKKAGNAAISQVAKGVAPTVIEKTVLENIPMKVSPVANVENAVKNLYIDQMFDNFYDDAAGHGSTLFDAYESFLPFISQSLSKNEKKAIEKARDLFYEYGEDEIPDRVYDKISKGVDILQEKLSEKGGDIPIKDVLSPDMYKMSLEDMKDYGVEITPEVVEQLKKTEWAPDVFHEFETP